MFFGMGFEHMLSGCDLVCAILADFRIKKSSIKPDGLKCFPVANKANKTVGSRPDRRLAFFTGLKKVSKERTTLAAGISVARIRCIYDRAT